MLRTAADVMLRSSFCGDFGEAQEHSFGPVRHCLDITSACINNKLLPLMQIVKCNFRRVTATMSIELQ